MNDRPFAAHRRADADRCGADRCRAEPGSERYRTGSQRRRLHDVGDSAPAAARHEIVDKQTNQQSAGRGHQNDVPGGQIVDDIRHLFERRPERAGLHQYHGFAEQHRAQRRRGTGHDRKKYEDKLPVSDEPAQWFQQGFAGHARARLAALQKRAE